MKGMCGALLLDFVQVCWDVFCLWRRSYGLYGLCGRYGHGGKGQHRLVCGLGGKVLRGVVFEFLISRMNNGRT